MASRPVSTINLTVPHSFKVGDRYDQPHFDDTESWLVTGVDGQTLYVVHWSWWRDVFLPRWHRLTHPEEW